VSILKGNTSGWWIDASCQHVRNFIV